MGRPKSEKGISPQIGARVPHEIKDAIVRIVVREDRTESQVIKRLLLESPTLKKELKRI